MANCMTTKIFAQCYRPITSARLGSQSLLQKCVMGYTQNANESLHSTVWKFCRNELFMGKTGVETACSLAVCVFNDGANSLSALSDRLQLDPTDLARTLLRKKDKRRLAESEYKDTEGAKKLRRLEAEGIGWPSPTEGRGRVCFRGVRCT
jgi:hypothetical protein